MRDVAFIQRRIRIALACAPVLAAAACADRAALKPDDPTTRPPEVRTPEAVVADGDGGGVTPPASTPEQTPVALPSDPVKRPRTGGCPSGEFCSTTTAVKGWGRRDAAVVDGCPALLVLATLADTNAPAGMPRGVDVDTTLDRAQTASRRQAGGAEANTCCYTWVESCARPNQGSRGRALMDHGRAVVADTHAVSARERADRPHHRWTAKAAEPLGQHLAPAVRRRIAEEWLQDARMEHASVASFARTTMELMAVGAPPDLLRASHHAGLDEIRHAELCFELVSAYGGAELEPRALRPVAPREPTLLRLAHDTFIEGCVGETIAALYAARASDSSPSPVKEVWCELADDETKHAELAWKTIAWICEQDSTVLAMLNALANELFELERSRPIPPREAALEGRLGAVESQKVTLDAWTHVILPSLSLIERG